MEDLGEELEYEKINGYLVESRESSLSWLWSKGLWLVQKVLVTSFILSSAPLALPPLLVVTAVGFAVAVPAGIAMASYICAEKLMSKLLPFAASRSMMLEGKDGSVEQNEQIGVVEKELGVVSDDMCVDSIANIGEIEGNDVSPDASFDEEYYAEDAGEYNGVEKIESHDISDPMIGDFGGEEVKEPTNETDSPIEVENSWTVVQEDPEKESPKKETKESPKKETDSPIEVKDVGTLVQEDTKEELPKKETDSAIEVKDVGTLVQEDPKQESPEKETISPIDVNETSIQEHTKEEPIKEETDSPIGDVKDVETLVQEHTKEEPIKEETDSPIGDVKDVEKLVQEHTKEEPIKEETNSPIDDVKDVETLVQEHTKEEPIKEETDSPIDEVKDVETKEEPIKEETDSPIGDVKDVETLVQEHTKEEPIKEEIDSPIEVKDVGILVQDDTKEELTKKETDSLDEVKDVGALVQEDPKQEPVKEEETDRPIEVKDFGTLVQEDPKKEQPKKETNSAIEVMDVGTLVQEEPIKKETDSAIDVKDVGTSVQEDTKEEPTKKETDLIEVKNVGTWVHEDPKKELPKKETSSVIEVKDVGTLVQEDPKIEQPTKETNSTNEVKDVRTLVQEDLPKKETKSSIEVKDMGTLVQEDTKEEPTKKETDLAIEGKDVGTLVQEDTKEEPTKKETDLATEVKDVGTLVQEDTKSADTKKLAVPIMVSREAQGTAGSVAEVKIPQGTTGVLKNTHDGGISHEPSKKNKKKIKPSGLKTSHGVEGKKDHKTVTSTKETGESLEVGDEKLKTVDPNALKADHIGVKGEKTTVQVENLVPTVEMKKSVILESIIVEDRSTTMGDDKPIRYQSVSVIANQVGEDRHDVDENVKLGMGNKRTTKEIRIKDSAADDNFDKPKAIPSSTKAKGITGNVNVDKKRAGSVTGVPKDPVAKGSKTSKQDSGGHKALLDEKKLWEQVDALRLIVGYKATRQPSLIEELKALYVFTGIKPPPSSLQDSDDIRGTEDKLHFLMSIVGVK